MKGYRLGDEFPREAFVQAAIERHFSDCERLEAGWADFACRDAGGNLSRIEAKGKTSDIGLDFRTGLGQLLQGMPREGWRYALAVPDIPQFDAQRHLVPDYVRRALNLSWLVVSEDAPVRVVEPDED